MSTTSKKVKQSDVVINYLNEKPGRKITTDQAMKITKAKSRASMNYLLPTMMKDGLITRVDAGVYALPGTVSKAKSAPKKTAPIAVKKALPFKKSTTVLDTVSMKSKLIAKKQEHLNSVEAIDKQIENIDKLEIHATSVIKNASTVL